MIAYYTKTAPEIIEADEKAGKGGWKIVFLLALFFALLAAFLHYYYGVSDNLLEWAAWIPALIYFGYYFVRRQNFRRAARKQIEEKQQREMEAPESNT